MITIYTSPSLVSAALSQAADNMPQSVASSSRSLFEPLLQSITIESLSTLLWPLIIVFVIFRYRKAMDALIASASSRKFTIKVGGQELTMEEANTDLRKYITDLQQKVVELGARIDGSEKKMPELFEVKRVHIEDQGQGKEEDVSKRDVSVVTPAAPQSRSAALAKRLSSVLSDLKAKERPILWVDDNPKNNSYFIQMLQDSSFTVDLALSTEDGLGRMKDKQYLCIISDMGRLEGKVFNSSAGLDLLKKVRGANSAIPFVIYCSGEKVRQFGEEAQQSKVTVITSSPTVLTASLTKILTDASLGGKSTSD